MPKKVALSTIIVVRDNKRVEVKPNSEPFDFTADEIKQIEKSESGGIKLLRNPVNESKADDESETTTATKTSGRGRGAAANKDNEL